MSDATFNSYFGEAKLVLERRNLGRPCKGSTSPTSRTPLLPQHVRYMWFLLPKDHIRRALRWLWGFLTCSRRLSGLRVSELGTRSRKRLGRFIVLCSWGKHHTFILPLFTLEYERRIVRKPWWSAEGDLNMDWRPIQGGVIKLLVTSCYRNRYELRLAGSLDSSTD